MSEKYRSKKICSSTVGMVFTIPKNYLQIFFSLKLLHITDIICAL